MVGKYEDHIQQSFPRSIRHVVMSSKRLLMTGPNDQQESEHFLCGVCEFPVNLMLGPVICTPLLERMSNSTSIYLGKHWYNRYYTPTRREGAILQSPCPSIRPFTLRIFHVCHNENFRNSYLSFYRKKWLYIWYMALAWWLIPWLPFPGLPHIYFLFTVRLTNERVGVFLARRSMQHLVFIFFCVVN